MSEISFNCEAGFAIRGSLRRAIKSYAYERGFGIKVEEDKGLLESLFHFTLIVPDAKYDITLQELNAWMKGLNQ